jgi:L-asparaginase II
MPLDQATATRLARDGEKAGPVRHMCSGQHAVAILISKLNGWEAMGYWMPDHPAQVVIRDAVARGLGVARKDLGPVTDPCGLPSWAVPLRVVAGAYAALAQPAALASSDPRSALAPVLGLVRDAMLANPEMVGGAHDRLDTSLMKELPGRVVSVSALERLRAISALPGSAGTGSRSRASGIAIRIEDGGADPRAGWSVTVETLAQAGLMGPSALRALGRYHRPITRDPHGRPDSETVAEFELIPVGELVP